MTRSLEIPRTLEFLLKYKIKNNQLINNTVYIKTNCQLWIYIYMYMYRFVFLSCIATTHTFQSQIGTSAVRKGTFLTKAHTKAY